MVRDTQQTKHAHVACHPPHARAPRTASSTHTNLSLLQLENKLTATSHTPAPPPRLLQCHDPGTPDIALVNACIKGGVNINLQDSHGCTAMNWVSLRLLHLLPSLTHVRAPWTGQHDMLSPECNRSLVVAPSLIPSLLSRSALVHPLSGQQGPVGTKFPARRRPKLKTRGETRGCCRPNWPNQPWKG